MPEKEDKGAGIAAQVAERIQGSDNVLVALSKNPSVDDLSAALAKCEAMGIDPATVGLDESKIGFMVVDMTEELGTMMQLIDGGAKFIHDMVIEAGKNWDGETDLIRPMG